MSKLLEDLAFTYKQRYENEKLNQAFNYFNALEELGINMMENDPNIDLETILYSKYYWFGKFMKYHKLQYGEEKGIEQKQFKILEELDQQFYDGIDFSIIQEIEELIYKQD